MIFLASLNCMKQRNTDIESKVHMKYIATQIREISCLRIAEPSRILVYNSHNHVSTVHPTDQVSSFVVWHDYLFVGMEIFIL